MPNQVIVLAYEAAKNFLAQQDATLTGLRNRATGLLAATSVGTAFAASVGFINNDPSKGPVFPLWAGWTLAALVVGIGGGVMTVLWPIRRWGFGPKAQDILERSAWNEDSVRNYFVKEMTVAKNYNAFQLVRKMRAYRISVVLLLAETIVLLVAMTVEQR